MLDSRLAVIGAVGGRVVGRQLAKMHLQEQAAANAGRSVTILSSAPSIYGLYVGLSSATFGDSIGVNGTSTIDV